MLKLNKTYDSRVKARKPLISPNELRRTLPISDKAKQTVVVIREKIKKILKGKSSKIIVVLGPCSIHNKEQAMLNGRIVKALQYKVEDTMVLIMRTYFEKPRTISGWKGLLNDPQIDKSFDINNGLVQARKILIDLNEMGVPCGMEILSQVCPERLGGLLTWNCIGARTSESQNHREWASGLSTAVGFKNGSSGQIDIAVNAVKAAKEACAFPGNDHQGKSCIIETTGNDFCHIVLRGGQGSNYSPVSVEQVIKKLQDLDLPVNIFIDCSHGNSGNNPSLQKHAWNDSILQIVDYNSPIKGLLLETNVVAGKQEFIYGQTRQQDLNSLQSITDKCIGKSETEELLLSAHEKLLTLNNVIAT